MRRLLIGLTVIIIVALAFVATPVGQATDDGSGRTAAAGRAAARGGAAPAWAMDATIIEACSCKMFCQCYFNTMPSEHTSHGADRGGGEHFCRFNNALRVDSGHYNAVKLDGAKFWIAGDLGGDFTKGMDWAVLTYDPAVTPEQRKGIQEILSRLYPVKWNSFTIAPDAPMEWHHTATDAVARLDGGKAAEVVLKRATSGMNADEPTVMTNLKYFGAPRNDGFIMMPNEVEAYRLGDKAFEFKGTNGFMITVHIDANTAPPAAPSGM
jgi:hypothetical protein